MYVCMYLCIFITHRIISAGSHWIKLIRWYKIGRWLSDDILRLIWYPPSDFISMEEKTKKQAKVQAKLLIGQGKPKKTFCKSQLRINTRLVDNSVPRNTKKSTKGAGTIYTDAVALRNYSEGYKIKKPLFGLLVYRRITPSAEKLS